MLEVKMCIMEPEGDSMICYLLAMTSRETPSSITYIHPYDEVQVAEDCVKPPLGVESETMTFIWGSQI